jgi:hypothetical protein
MRNPSNCLLGILAMTVSLGAHAAAQRTFVSSTGNDANACSIVAPCRGFAAAVAQTSPGGEVIVLDSAGYGAATLASSISLIAPPGVYAGVAVFSGDGITINDASAVVVLRGLSINGQGGQSGISVLAAAEVHVENVTISNMQQSGIFMNTNAPLLIKDSIVRDNGGHGIGVYLGTATLANVRSDRNFGSGLYVQGGAYAAVSGGSFSQNFGNGMDVQGSTLEVHGAAISLNQTDGVFVNIGVAALDDCAIDANVVSGVAVVGANIILSGYVTMTRGHANLNGRTLGTGGGVKANNGFTDLQLTGVTLENNYPVDVDATNCCVYTFNDNVWVTTSGSSLTLFKK